MFEMLMIAMGAIVGSSAIGTLVYWLKYQGGWEKIRRFFDE